MASLDERSGDADQDEGDVQRGPQAASLATTHAQGKAPTEATNAALLSGVVMENRPEVDGVLDEVLHHEDGNGHVREYSQLLGHRATALLFELVQDGRGGEHGQRCHRQQNGDAFSLGVRVHPVAEHTAYQRVPIQDVVPIVAPPSPCKITPAADELIGSSAIVIQEDVHRVHRPFPEVPLVSKFRCSRSSRVNLDLRPRGRGSPRSHGRACA
mmetsp:Transcript_108793/g.306584  ORF Transcript_108793/g.306584 Transcript_108793/m.306584 type:complete len:213 (+) Transcript_108793:608-1246(+)